MSRGLQRVKAWLKWRGRQRRTVIELAAASQGNESPVTRNPSRIQIGVRWLGNKLGQPRNRVWLRGLTFLFLIGAAYGLWQGSRVNRLMDELALPPPSGAGIGDSFGVPQLGMIGDFGSSIDAPLFDVPQPPRALPETMTPIVSVRGSDSGMNEAEPVISVPALPDILDLAQVVWPVTGGVQGDYGWHRDPVTNDWRFRSGVIIEPERDQAPVRASLPGVVDTINTSGNGYRVVLTHAEGWSTEYVGLSSLDVTAGQHLTAGDRLGQISVAPHRSGLYFVMRDASGPVNPQGILYTPPN